MPDNQTKQKQQKPIKLILITVAVAAVTAVVTVILVYYQKSQSKTAAPATKPAAVALPSGETVPTPSLVKANLSFDYPPSVTVGQNFSVAINLKTEAALSGIAIRILYPLSKKNGAGTAILPLGEKLIPNPKLIKDGWSFLINKIYQEKEANIMVAELTAAYLNPAGYKISNETTIATLEFKAASPTEALTLSFDPQKTKIINKNNQQLPIDYKKAILRIK